MAIEKKVEILEGEVKLMKGELKEALTSVRDFLLNLKLPPPQIEGLDGGDNRVTIDGGLSMDSRSTVLSQALSGAAGMALEGSVTQPVELPQPDVSSMAGVPPRVQMREVVSLPQAVVGEPPSTGAEAPAEAPAAARLVEVEGSPQLVTSEPSEQPGEQKRFEEGEVVRLPERKREEEIPEPVTGQASGPTSQVNLLANLLRWVSVAAKKIGIGQLSTFLDIYGTTGNLSPEIRGIILRFASVVEQLPSDARTAVVLSKLMSEQLATFLEVHSVNGHLSQEMKESILRFASVIAEQASDARTSGVWNQLMSEQLATFLEMHSASGQLSPEVKEGVLRFIGTMVSPPIEINEADVASQADDRNVADVWSQLILELHGILTGGGTALQSLRQFQNGTKSETGVGENEVEEDNLQDPARLEKDEPVTRAEEKPVILKLVLPASDGVEREFSINLTTEVGGDGSLGQSSNT